MRPVTVLLGICTLFSIVGAFLAGRLPERERRLVLLGERHLMESRLETAEARVRFCGLLAQIHGVQRLAAKGNYVEAKESSDLFFDQVRAELERTSEAAVKEALQATLASRAPIATSLAQGRPDALRQIARAESRLQGALRTRFPRVPEGGSGAEGRSGLLGAQCADSRAAPHAIRATSRTNRM